MNQTIQRLLPIFVVIISLSATTPAQPRPVNSNDQLLESGQATKLTLPVGAPTKIKIVSYNIRWRSGKELAEIIAWLRAKDSQPTIIGLQEVDRVLDIFVRANEGGTKLSKSDLLLSLVTSKWVGNAREEIYGFVDRINSELTRKNEFDKDFTKLLLRQCAVVLQQIAASHEFERDETKLSP